MKRAALLILLVAVVMLGLAPLAGVAKADGPYSSASSSFYQSQSLHGAGTQTQVLTNSSVYYTGYGYTYGTSNTTGIQFQNIYWGSGSQSQGYSSNYSSRGYYYHSYYGGW